VDRLHVPDFVKGALQPQHGVDPPLRVQIDLQLTAGGFNPGFSSLQQAEIRY